MLVSILLVVFHVLIVSYSQIHFAFVEDLVIRLDPPATDNDCLTGAPGAFGDGESFTADSLLTTIFYCGRFRSLNRFEQIYVSIETPSGGFTESSDPIVITGSFFSRRAIDFAIINDFDGENPIIVRGFVVNTQNNNIIDELSVSVSYALNTPQATVDKVKVRGPSGRVTDDGTPIDVSGSDQFTFTAVFNDVKVGDQVQIDIKSDNVPNGVVSDLVTIDSAAALFKYRHTRQLEIFEKDNQLSIGASVYDSTGTLIDSLEDENRFLMNINYIGS